MWKKIRSSPHLLWQGVILLLIAVALYYFARKAQNLATSWIGNLPFERVTLWAGALIAMTLFIVFLRSRGLRKFQVFGTVNSAIGGWWNEHWKTVFGTIAGLTFLNVLLANLTPFQPLYAGMRDYGILGWENVGIFVAVMMAATFGKAGGTFARITTFLLLFAGVAFLWKYFGHHGFGRHTANITSTQNVSSDGKFSGPAIDFYNGPYQEFLRERFKDYPTLADICASESGSRHWEDSLETIVLKNNNPNGTTDIGLCQINSVHSEVADSLGFDLMTPEGNADFTEWLFLRDGTLPWESSACRWREHDDSCSVLASRPSSIASSPFVPDLTPIQAEVLDPIETVQMVTDSIVTLPADGSFVGPIFVGNPDVYTFKLLPKRSMFIEFKYPDGRTVQSMQPRALHVGKVSYFWLRVADGMDGEFRFSRTRRK